MSNTDASKTEASKPKKKKKLPLKKRLYHWWVYHRPKLIISTIFLFIVLVYFWEFILISIYPGQLGVKWNRFSGTVLTRTYDEGLHLIFPWDKMYIYDVRVQEVSKEITLLSSDGLPMTLKTSIRYFPDRARLTQLHTRIGPDYADKVVIPETISALRRVLGNYNPEEIYFRDEQGLLQDIQTIAKQHIEVYPIKLFDVLILYLTLPEDVQTAINKKHAHEQDALAYKFILEREEQIRERREIEAQGIKTFQDISGISILKWRGIEATENLANSENAKFVIIGPDDQSLPVILNVDR